VRKSAAGPSLHLPQRSIAAAFGGIADWRAAGGAHCSTRDSAWSPSPQASSEPSGARIDATLALNEPIQRLRNRLVRGGVPHDAGPFTPRPFFGFGGVSGASDDGREGIFPTTQAESPASPVNFPALRRPHRDQAIHGAQVPINRVSVPAGLALSPGIADPLQVLAQGF
jgi:hypothetical protein